MSASDTYTHGHGNAVVAQHARRTAATCAGHLTPLLDSADSILDVGCGPGSISCDLAQLVPKGAVVAIDVSEEVLTGARGLASDRQIGNISFETGDVYALSAPDGSYDVVHAHQVLQHLSRPVDALVEMRRVAREGGLVAVRDADYGTFVHSPNYPMLDVWLDMYHAIARTNEAEPDAGRFLLRWCREAGLDDVTISTETWTFVDQADKLNWGDSWATRTLSSSLGDQAVEYGIATKHELDQMADAWRRWARDPNSLYYFVHVSAVARVSARPT